MPADELRKGLRSYTDFLIKEREERAASFAEYGFETDKARAGANALALGILWIYTDGEFGEERKPKAAAEADGGAGS